MDELEAKAELKELIDSDEKQTKLSDNTTVLGSTWSELRPKVMKKGDEDYEKKAEFKELKEEVSEKTADLLLQLILAQRAQGDMNALKPQPISKP